MIALLKSKALVGCSQRGIASIFDYFKNFVAGRGAYSGQIIPPPLGGVDGTLQGDMPIHFHYNPYMAAQENRLSEKPKELRECV